MGLQRISVQLVFYPHPTVDFEEPILEAFDPREFRIERISVDQINYIELIGEKGANGADLDEVVLAMRFRQTAAFLRDLSEPLRAYLRGIGAYLEIGGWSLNDGQITNLIIPPEFNAETAALGLRYDFCINDYHD